MSQDNLYRYIYQEVRRSRCMYTIRENTAEATESMRKSTNTRIFTYQSAQFRLSRRDVWFEKYDSLKKNND